MAGYMYPENAYKRTRSPDLTLRSNVMVPVPPPRDAFQLYFAAHLTVARRGSVLSTEWTHHVATVWERCKKMWPSVTPADKRQMDEIARNERSFYDRYWAQVAPVAGITHESAVRIWENHAHAFTRQLLDEVKIDYSNLSPGYLSGSASAVISPYHQLGGLTLSMDGSSSHRHAPYLDPGYSAFSSVALQNTVCAQLPGQPVGTKSPSPPSISGLYPYSAGVSSQYSMPSWNNGVPLPSSQGYSLSSSTVSTPIMSPGSANIPAPITQQRRRSANPSGGSLRADSTLASTRRRLSTRGRPDPFRVT